MKIEVGDLVQLKGIWENKVGIVLATENNRGKNYVIRGHIDACHCIADLKEVKLIKKQIVPKKYKRYLA
jgi:hypothetical protein